MGKVAFHLTREPPIASPFVKKLLDVIKGKGRGVKKEREVRKMGRRGKGEGGEETRCAVGIFNCFRLCCYTFTEPRPITCLKI